MELPLRENKAPPFCKHCSTLMRREDCGKTGLERLGFIQSNGSTFALCVYKEMLVLSVCVDTRDMPACLNGSHTCAKVAFWCLGHFEQSPSTAWSSFRTPEAKLARCLELCIYVFKWSQKEITVMWNSNFSGYA